MSVSVQEGGGMYACTHACTSTRSSNSKGAYGLRGATNSYLRIVLRSSSTPQHVYDVDSVCVKYSRKKQFQFQLLCQKVLTSVALQVAHSRTLNSSPAY